MSFRQSSLGIALLSGLLALSIGCQGMKSSSREDNSNNKDLMVYVTTNAPEVREKALSYGLDVKTIDQHSAASQLVQALLNSPTDEYFAVINPFQNRYIAGGAVSDKVDSSEIDQLFRNLKMVSRAGVQQIGRLQPATKGDVRLVIFSDYQCPYCKMMEGFVEHWQQKYGDKLEVELINFPLPNHEHSFAAAEAAECARDQGKFDPYKKALFEQQDQLGEYVFNMTARRLKLDMKKFMQCTSLHQERKKVRQDQYFGQYMGLTGTPTMYLNGEQLYGDSPEQIQAKIDTALGLAPAAPAPGETAPGKAEEQPAKKS